MHNNDNNNGNLPQTILRACSCGNYHLHYRYIMLTISKQTLFKIMEECYEWDEKRTHSRTPDLHKPFRLMIGLAAITIMPQDFREFNDAIQSATNEALSINDLVRQPKTR